MPRDRTMRFWQRLLRQHLYFCTSKASKLEYLTILIEEHLEIQRVILRRFLDPGVDTRVPRGGVAPRRVARKSPRSSHYKNIIIHSTRAGKRATASQVYRPANWHARPKHHHRASGKPNHAASVDKAAVDPSGQPASALRNPAFIPQQKEVAWLLQLHRKEIRARRLDVTVSGSPVSVYTSVPLY